MRGMQPLAKHDLVGGKHKICTVYSYRDAKDVLRFSPARLLQVDHGAFLEDLSRLASMRKFTLSVAPKYSKKEIFEEFFRSLRAKKRVSCEARAFRGMVLRGLCSPP